MLMYVRIESETAIAALCNSLSWNKKELKREHEKISVNEFPSKT